MALRGSTRSNGARNHNGRKRQYQIRVNNPTEKEAQMLSELHLNQHGPQSHAELLAICEQQGGVWRRVGASGYMVWGPHGEFKFNYHADAKPAKRWIRKKAIIAAREAGFIIPGPEYSTDPEVEENEEQETEVAIGEGQLSFPANAEGYDHTRSLDGLRQDVYALFRRVEVLSDRLESHGERLTELKRDIDRVSNGVRPLKSDKYARMRDDVMEWFATVPAGIWFGYRAIMDNMGIEPDRAHSYQQQLQNLVNEGRLEQKRGGQPTSTGRGGASYLYRIPPKMVDVPESYK